jgi:twitching motility two-component system response regulator PilG
MIIDPTRPPGSSAEAALPDARDSAARRDAPLMHDSIFGGLPASGPATHVPASADAPLVFVKLSVQGLQPVERQLLPGVVKVSQRRTPRLQLVEDNHARDADVVMVDARDPAAMAWARSRPWLAGRPVIWIDGTKAAPGHIVVRRPVQWPVLPMLLARALELGPAAKGSHVSPVGTPAAGATGQKVLVVHEALAERAQLRALLEQRGYAVTEADSVEVALRSLAQHPFDCVLIDMLAHGGDGYEGCRRIKESLHGVPGVPVVMLTSHGSPFDRLRGKMAGCDAYLTKPLDVWQLAEVLAQQGPTIPVRRINAAAGHGELSPPGSLPEGATGRRPRQ